MRDEYTLKIKLREGAFNLAQALANQTSKAAKEKLQEARLEQRDLLEDLCDIEDELETKLGVFKVHINGELWVDWYSFQLANCLMYSRFELQVVQFS